MSDPYNEEHETNEDARPRPRHLPDVEYEDEPPGAYLSELHAGRWTVAWAVVNLLLILGVAVLWFAGGFQKGESSVAPLRPIWSLLPFSAIAAAVVSAWFVVVEPGSQTASRFYEKPVKAEPQKGARAARASLGIALVSVVVWLILRYGFGIQLPEVEA